MPTRNDFVPGEFCWVDLNAHDLKAAAAWYSEVMGWTHHMMEAPGGGPPYAFLMQGEAVVGGLGEMSEEMKAAGIPPMWNNYIATSDCEATEAKVRELGGTVTVPTMEVPGHGKLAFFLDPEGASIAAWQTTTESGPPLLVGEPVSPGWNELMTRDMEKANAFYSELTGWEYSDMPMGDINYKVIKHAGKDAGGMMPMAGPQFEGVPAHWLLYLAVDDCAAMTAKVESNGGKVMVPTTDIAVGKFSVVSDPQGAAFAFIEMAQG